MGLNYVFGAQDDLGWVRGLLEKCSEYSKHQIQLYWASFGAAYGPKRGCSDFRRILLFLFRVFINFILLGFVWWLSKYIAWLSTVFHYALFYATLETERITKVLEIFYLKVFSIIFLIIFSMISIMNMWN